MRVVNLTLRRDLSSLNGYKKKKQRTKFDEILNIMHDFKVRNK